MNFSKFFIFLGIFFLILSAHLVYQRYSPKKLEFKNLNVSKSVSSELTPVKVSVPRLGIENLVISSQIEDGKWEATNDGISFLSNSPVPGYNGNSIFYGHNWPNLLGKLTQVKPGDRIEVLLNNGDKKIFKVEYTSVVDPSQTHILDQTKDQRITIYTCTGFLDSKRFVATAILSK